MGSIGDYEIENGDLKKYLGPGGDVKIPEGVTSIGDRGFFGCDRLTGVNIPEGVTSIGSGAFSGCRNLTDARIPGSVIHIGECAFLGCSGLADQDGFVVIRGVLYDYSGPGGYVKLPDHVTGIGTFAFRGCHRLRGVRIPKGVASIGEGAFENCMNLRKVRIPSGVTSIGERAFSWCESLKSVILPDSVTSIGRDAFCGCRGLADRKGFVIIRGTLYGYFGADTEIRIPESVTHIEGGAFNSARGLDRILIPVSVASIGQGAIRSIWNLKTVICPAPYSEAGYYKENPFENVKNLVYLGGPPTDFPKEYRARLCRGFFYAREHGISEIEQWREVYLDFIGHHFRAFFRNVEEDRDLLLLLLQRDLLDEEAVRTLMDHFSKTDDVEVTAALLQYHRENFGTDVPGALSL